MWWEYNRTDEMVRIAQELPLLRDMLTLLRFVNTHKVIGTQSTGNMPLKMVREVAAEFVNPPTLDVTIGKHVYRLRSEADIWPLFFLHVLAEVGGLLHIAPGRRWRLTKDGKIFLDADPLQQVSFLLAIWWYRVNWLLAYPVSGMGDHLPQFFNYDVLNELLSLELGVEVPIGQFADVLIKKTGLSWLSPENPYANEFLQNSIENMVVQILEDFGAVACEYRDKVIGKSKISKMYSFKIVPFGSALLEAVAMTQL